MNAPAITLEVLPAGYGDCLLIACPVDGRTWRLLVDTGPDECWPLLRSRLAEIAPDDHGKRHIDLAVISHIDHDHIGDDTLLCHKGGFHCSPLADDVDRADLLRGHGPDHGLALFEHRTEIALHCRGPSSSRES